MVSAIKLAVSAGSKIYANKQKTKMAMSDAQLMHASRMARRKGSLPRKTFRSTTIGLEGRGGSCNFVGAHSNFGVGSRIEDPTAMDKVKLFFDMFSRSRHGSQIYGSLSWRVIYGIKGTQIFRKRRKKIMRKYYNKGGPTLTKGTKNFTSRIKEKNFNV